VLRAGPDVPPALNEVGALRAASARLWQLVEGKDTEIAALCVSHQAQLALLGPKLAAPAAASVAGMIRRQVTEVPPVRPVVAERQMIASRCCCGMVTALRAPAGMSAPTGCGLRLTAIGASSTGQGAGERSHQ